MPNSVDALLAALGELEVAAKAARQVLLEAEERSDGSLCARDRRRVMDRVEELSEAVVQAAPRVKAVLGEDLLLERATRQRRRETRMSPVDLWLAELAGPAFLDEGSQ